MQCEKQPIAWHVGESGDTTKKVPILSKDDIMEKYTLDEKSKDNMWQYSFTLRFTGRRFELACRTVQELENWLRVFNLLLKMDESPGSLEETLTRKNPFVFEHLHGKLPN